MSGASGRSNEVHSALRGMPEAKPSFYRAVKNWAEDHPMLSRVGILSGAVVLGFGAQIAYFMDVQRESEKTARLDAETAKSLPVQLTRGSLVTADNAFCSAAAPQNRKFVVTLSDGTKAGMDCSLK
jgi:hypothetical protein